MVVKNWNLSYRLGLLLIDLLNWFSFTSWNIHHICMAKSFMFQVTLKKKFIHKMFSSFGVWNIGHGSPPFTHSDLTVQIPQSLGQKRSHDVTFGAVFWSLNGEGPRIHLQIHKGYRHSKARCMPFRSCDMCSNIPILWTSSFSPADLSLPLL